MIESTTTYKKTTATHFKIFKEECEKWIKRAGLFGWRFCFEHDDLCSETEQSAYILYPDSVEDRVFTIGLTKTFPFEFTILDIRRTAFHEVMEALLYKVYWLATARYVQKREIDEEIHNVIRTMERMVFK